MRSRFVCLAVILGGCSTVRSLKLDADRPVALTAAETPGAAVTGLIDIGPI